MRTDANVSETELHQSTEGVPPEAAPESSGDLRECRTETSDLVVRLRSSEPLPFCPYDSRSPDYWTAPDDKPCKVCGGLNDSNAPDLCRGADTRLFREAADEIETLRSQRDEARQLVTEANNSLYGSQGYFHSLNGSAFDQYHLARGIENLKAATRPLVETRTITSEDMNYASELLADLSNGGEPRLFVAAQWFCKARVEHSLGLAPTPPALSAKGEG